MALILKCLKAEHGDAFIITIGQGIDMHYIVVDGGPSSKFCMDDIVQELKPIPVIDLMVLTHFDDDHIAGLLAYIKEYEDASLPVKEIWANCSKKVQIRTSAEISYSQANTLDNYLDAYHGSQGLLRKDNINNTLQRIDLGFCRILILSPTPDALQVNMQQYVEKVTDVASQRVDNDRNKPLEELSLIERKPQKDGDDVINRSSIAFLLEAEGKTLLMMGDADPWVVCNKLREMGYSELSPFKVDLMKVSHHGSRNNICNELIGLLDCSQYLFSTNGGFGNSFHPDRETLAKILCNARNKDGNDVRLYFNYPLSEIELRTGSLLTEDEIKEYNCTICDDAGIIPII